MNLLLHTTRASKRREQSYCVIAVLAFICYSLKSYWYNTILHCQTRRNTSNLDTTEPNQTHSTFRKNRDADTPKNDYERNVTFAAYQLRHTEQKNSTSHIKSRNLNITIYEDAAYRTKSNKKSRPLQFPCTTCNPKPDERAKQSTTKRPKHVAMVEF